MNAGRNRWKRSFLASKYGAAAVTVANTDGKLQQQSNNYVFWTFFSSLGNFKIPTKSNDPKFGLLKIIAELENEPARAGNNEDIDKFIELLKAINRAVYNKPFRRY